MVVTHILQFGILVTSVSDDAKILVFYYFFFFFIIIIYHQIKGNATYLNCVRSYIYSLSCIQSIDQSNQQISCQQALDYWLTERAPLYCI